MYKNRNLVALYGATLFSGLGTGCLLVLVYWTIVTEFNRSSIIATTSSVSYLLCFLILPNISRYIDRYNKVRLLQIFYLVAGSAQLLFSYLYSSGEYKVYILIIAMLISIVIRMIDQASRLAIAQSLVDKKAYHKTSRQLEILRQAITLISGGVAWFVIDSVSMCTILLIDASTFFFGAILLLLICKESNNNVATEEKKNSLLDDIKMTVSLYKNNAYFCTFLTLSIIPYVLVLSQSNIHPAHVDSLLDLSGNAYAIMGLLFGIGSLFAPFLSAALKQRGLATEMVIIASFLGYCVSSLLIFAYPEIYVTYLCMLLFSLFHSVIRIERIAYIMEHTPKHVIGRVSGSFELIGLTLIVGIIFIVGQVADHLGVYSAWVLMATISILFFLSLLLLYFSSSRKARSSSIVI